MDVRAKTAQRRRPLPRTGLPYAAAAAAGGGAMVVGALLRWVRIATDSGGTTTVSGFGGISGDTQAAGDNLNDLLDVGGTGSFRPGLLALVFGLLALLVALWVALLRADRPGRFRSAASVLLICGVTGLGWGLWNAVDPGPAGLLQPGDAGSGAGPWLVAVGGAVLTAVAVGLLAGRADPVPRQHRRGIQPT